MKSTAKVLAPILLLLTLSLLVSCKGPKNPPETTTTQSGEHVHEYLEEKIPPNCVLEGYTLHFCKSCDHYYTDNPVATVPHTYTDIVTAPTCTVEGYTTHICSVCGHSYTDTPTEKAPHTWLAYITSPTCTVEGYTEHICSLCGETYRDTPTAPGGHFYLNEVIRPTGTEQGYNLHTCIHCGDAYRDTYTDPVDRTVVMQFHPMGGLLPEYPRNTYLYDTGTQVTLPVPTREGYVFTGWYTEEEGGDLVPDGIWSIAEDSWLYAGWAPISVPLTLDIGEGGQSIAFFGRTLSWDEPVGSLVAPTPRFGYVFDGWFDGDTRITEETVSHYTEPVTLVARYLAPIASGQVVGEKNDGYYWAVYHDGTLRFRTNLTDPKDTSATFAIPDDAFRGMREITAVELTDQVKDIGNYAFADCTSLRSIYLPGTIGVIRSSILEGCTALTEVTVGSGIMVINEDAFKGCSALRDLTLPLSLYQIYSPFGGCSLRQVRYEGTAFQWSVIVKDKDALAALEAEGVQYEYEVKYPES